MPDENTPPAQPPLDPEKPSIARTNDYLLGGSFNTPVDRAFAERVLQVLPAARTMAVDNRNFLSRVVTYLIDAGIRQFLDLGSGVPTVGNVHQIARQHAPDTAVVYVDNDPLAVAQSRRLAANEPTTTVVVEADLRHPAAVLGHPTVRGVLDFTQPIAALMIGVLHFIPDNDNPGEILAGYCRALPPGSYLAISHLDDENAPTELRAQVRRCIETYQGNTGPLIPRTRDTLAQWLRRLSIVPPGVVSATTWHADHKPMLSDAEHNLVIGAVARLT